MDDTGIDPQPHPHRTTGMEWHGSAQPRCSHESSDAPLYRDLQAGKKRATMPKLRSLLQTYQYSPEMIHDIIGDHRTAV
ncbi:MAG: hypothetical protein HRT36_08835 [Alphaproteobacteria bacterium]|nr:hypothetical protein [Alphaproteobacteria bacterium]